MKTRTIKKEMKEIVLVHGPFLAQFMVIKRGLKKKIKNKRNAFNSSSTSAIWSLTTLL